MPLYLLTLFEKIFLNNDRMVVKKNIVLKTQKGNVRGKRVDAEMGAYYYSFRGIRYAQAPTGKLRFKVR